MVREASDGMGDKELRLWALRILVLTTKLK
jgi:hypothetical protein